MKEPRHGKNGSVDLVDESPDTQLFATKKKHKGKTYEKYIFVLKREPQFTLESYDGECSSEFIKRTSSNQLVGLIENGELECSDTVEKIFFLSKLDLKPKSKISNNAHNVDKLFLN